MIAFYIMFCGTFFLCLSQAMMINSLPAILVEFDINAGYGQLITTGYIFALGLLSASTATLIDRFSTKRLCLFSFATFIVGCALCYFAHDFSVLLVGRLLQAGGAGISLPLVQDVALFIYPKEEYGRAMGAVGLIIGFAPAVGPAVAGPIIDYLGWRAMFIILGVIVSTAFVLALFFVHDMAEHRSVNVNVKAVSLFCAGFILLMCGLTQVEAVGIASVTAWLLLAAGGVAIGLYIRCDVRSDDPFLHLKCFKTRRFTIDCILIVFAQFSMMVASIMVPLYVQGVQGDTATISGLVIMPGAILLGLLNPVTGRLYDRYGARPLALAGFAMIFAGTAAFILCTPTTPGWVVTLLYGLRTLGIACTWMPMVADASVALPLEEATQATSITTSLRQLCSSMMSTVFISIMAACTVDASGVSDFGFDVSFGVLAAVSFGVLALAFFTVRWKDSARS